MPAAPATPTLEPSSLPGGSLRRELSLFAAVLLVGLLIAALVLVGNVKTTWSFSAFTVLVYYAITNLAALRLAPPDRLFPRAFAWLGLAGCLFLAFWVQWQVWLAGLGLLGVGLIWHQLAMRRRVQASASS